MRYSHLLQEFLGLSKPITCHPGRALGPSWWFAFQAIKPSPFFSFEILPGTCFHDSNRWRKLDIGWPCDLHSGLAAMMTPTSQWNSKPSAGERDLWISSPAGLNVTERLPKGPPKQIDSKESLPFSSSSCCCFWCCYWWILGGPLFSTPV